MLRALLVILLSLGLACGDDDDGADEGENFELVIMRADGSEEVIYLVSEPVGCGGSLAPEIVELCGEAIVNGQRIAVDFIMVNVAAGESYEVRER